MIAVWVFINTWRFRQETILMLVQQISLFWEIWRKIQFSWRARNKRINKFLFTSSYPWVQTRWLMTWYYSIFIALSTLFKLYPCDISNTESVANTSHQLTLQTLLIAVTVAVTVQVITWLRGYVLKSIFPQLSLLYNKSQCRKGKDHCCLCLIFLSFLCFKGFCQL